MSTIGLFSAFLPGRPVRQFGEQLIFLVMVWAGFTVTVMLITTGVSFFRPIEASGWALTSGAVRWFGFAICCYFGYSVVELHVLHGQTRRDFFVRLFAFIPVYAALLAALFAATFYLEAGYYALTGWTQGVPDSYIYSHPFQSHLVFLEMWMVSCVWAAGGVAISTAFYRSGLLGGVLIPLGLLASAISAALLGDDQLPFGVDQIFADMLPSLPLATLVHIILFAAFAALSWAIMRDMPIHSKTANA